MKKQSGRLKRKMKTENNFFTLCQKWSRFSYNAEIPRFYKQNIDFKDKIFVPYDEVETASKSVSIEKLIPHFFISDEKQVNFACNPNSHLEILDKIYAVFSTDFSIYINTYPQFNNAILLLNRLIASYWQQQDRFVILTLSWAGKESYETAFSNIEEGSIVGISTEGVQDWICFKNGFLTMLQQIRPAFICWYDKIPEWIFGYFEKERIIRVPKRFKIVSERKNLKIQKYQMELF